MCGAWPAIVEVRGLDRTRRFRCGRCGSDCPAEWLRCPFCEAIEHHQMGALVAGDAGEPWRVDTCDGCGGYVKSLTTLARTPAVDVRVRDLESVARDVAAIERGFRRPAAPGRAPRVACALAPRPGWLRHVVGAFAR